jgi:hypothetical protein
VDTYCVWVREPDSAWLLVGTVCCRLVACRVAAGVVCDLADVVVIRGSAHPAAAATSSILLVAGTCELLIARLGGPGGHD